MARNFATKEPRNILNTAPT